MSKKEKQPEPHPIQALHKVSGILRFRENAIVRYLLDNGTNDMNTLAALPFSREDRVQFAQLIGYSLSGFGELSYVTAADYEAAEAKSKKSNLTDTEVQLAYYKYEYERLRKELRDPMARLFEVHPDDLNV